MTDLKAAAEAAKAAREEWIAIRWRWRFAFAMSAAGARRLYFGPIEIERY